VSDDGVLSFYNLNGIILRSTTQADPNFAEVAVTIDSLRQLDDQLLVTIAAAHMALTDDLGVDYVFSDYSLQRFVLRAARLDRDGRAHLADTVVGVRGRMGLVSRLAEELFYVDGHGGPLVTSSDPALEPYRVTEGFGQEFVEAFSREYRATSPS
jgi:hypothetical protein